jgi:nicotinate phosphoribosyltransferase
MQNGQLITRWMTWLTIAQPHRSVGGGTVESVRQVQDPTPYTVEITPALAQLTQATRAGRDPVVKSVK